MAANQRKRRHGAAIAIARAASIMKNGESWRASANGIKRKQHGMTAKRRENKQHQRIENIKSAGSIA